ncbi:MAG: precorrin-6Y C5,15-methyltransferase (decarboxylating) subunit CbiT [Ruminococcus sp.]|nr:precorrin-6Y C5,15-methyltransferase (decarboxylating) subunit CbiT [Ruminococcus sp.]
MKVYIVGTGMDGSETLTKAAEKAISEAALLIGAERVVKPFMQLGKELFVSYKPSEIAEKLGSAECDTAAVLMSGDCGFFSGTRKLLPLLEAHDVTVISGISSAAYFCGKLGISYENMKFITLHGRPSSAALNVKMNEHCFFLLGGEMNAADVCRRLCEYGLGSVNVHIGTDLGYETEQIIVGKACELTDVQTGGLSVMITENREHLRHIPTAISDEKFTRGEIPMTKSEVRCIALSRLDIGADSVVWDIGCGTGSVSVEAACRCPDGKVYAFDKKSEAVTLTDENARKFSCDNIEAIQGVCPEILADMPVPDKVFIGGSSGKMDGIFEAVRAKNPSADIVVTAVSLETLNEAVSCFSRFGTEAEVVQIAVTRTGKLGTHTMLQAQNPVFIISGRLQ